MSYCRFSDGDVYMYADVGGGITCCACRLAPLVPTIFKNGEVDHPLFGKIAPCGCSETCCPKCGMHDSLNFKTEDEALSHLREHAAAGHDVPDYAIERLQEEIAAPTHGVQKEDKNG